MRNAVPASFLARLATAALALTLLGAVCAPQTTYAQAASTAQTAQATPDTSAAQPFPGLNVVDNGEDYELPIQLLLLLTVLSLAPAIIILMTSFTRLIVVFGILRQALGLRQSPPNQVIIGLSIFLTIFIMHPVFTEVNQKALQPYLEDTITQKEALERAKQPAKRFMVSQTREKDLMLFMDMAKIDGFDDAQAVPLYVLVPAFVISELRIAFQIGFMLFLPFLIIDLIVASVLMSMGMMMLPPVMISLPIKLLLFVLTDGWYLIVESVVRGYLGGG